MIFMSVSISRRRLLGSSSAALAAAAAPFGALLSSPAAAAVTEATKPSFEHPLTQRTVAEMLAMSPVDMARESRLVSAAFRVLVDAAEHLRDEAVRNTVLAILNDPVPTVADTDEDKVLAALKAEGLIDANRAELFPTVTQKGRAEQPFWSAPGSGYASHHAYPGGLATHCALNVLSAVRLLENYDSVFDCDLDYDAAVGGELLHDLHKPWVFAWQPDGSSRVEKPLAKTGEHHVLSLAESMKRGLPARVVAAQAAAHDHPGTPAGEALVVGWIRAAALIAGVDPVERGFLAADGKTLPLPRRSEGFVVHLADHDFVLSGPACQWSLPALKKLAASTYGLTSDKDFNSFRNYVFANLSAMRVWALLSNSGEAALAADVARILKA